MNAARKLLFQIAAITFLIFVVLSSSAAACPNCRAQIKSNIYDETFLINFGIMTFPLIIIGLVGIGLFYADDLQSKIKGQKPYGKK